MLSTTAAPAHLSFVSSATFVSSQGLRSPLALCPWIAFAAKEHPAKSLLSSRVAPCLRTRHLGCSLFWLVLVGFLNSLLYISLLHWVCVFSSTITSTAYLERWPHGSSSGQSDFYNAAEFLRNSVRSLTLEFIPEVMKWLTKIGTVYPQRWPALFMLKLSVLDNTVLCGRRLRNHVRGSWHCSATVWSGSSLGSLTC